MKPRCVLVVDDDENDRFFVEVAWQNAGVKGVLRMARDGFQALDYLAGAGRYSDRDQHPFPDLVLLDLKMPGKDGFEVLSWIRQQPGLAGLVVIILTASAHEEDQELAARLGANAFVVKPSNAEHLTCLLSAIQSFWFCFHVFSDDRTAVPV